MSTINIVLADDHQVVREGLKALLENQDDFNVLGSAGGGVEATKLVEQLRPDILILDLMMQDINGIEVTRQVTKRYPETMVIVLSMHNDEAYVVEALQAGAKGYVLKESSSVDLIQAIRAAVGGQRYLSPSLSERAIEAYSRIAKESILDPYDMLTTREREVLCMAAQGLTNAQIAEQLFIGHRTVETHRNSVMRKLQLKNQTALIRYAIKRKIISLDE